MLTRRTLAAISLPPLLPGRPNSRPRPSVLRVVPEFDLATLDPIVTTALMPLQHGYMIYDTLFATDSAYRPQPQMVGGYSASRDGASYEFELRDQLRFHDGTSVSARDCVASVRRWGARDVMGRLLLSRTADLVATGERTFRLRLSAPFPLVLHALAKMAASPCFVMREQDAMTDPSIPITTAIGSGPFRYNARDRLAGALIAYDRNGSYVPRAEPPNGYSGGKVARVERVEFHVIPDPQTQVGAIRRDEVDMVPPPPVELLATLKDDPEIDVSVSNRQAWTVYLRPNHLFPPFDALAGRQALAALVDRSAALTAAAGDLEYWRECRSFVGCDQADRQAAALPDLAQAADLLAKAGYRGEPLVMLDPVNDPAFHGLTEVTAQQLRRAGVQVAMRSLDTATFLADRASQRRPGDGGWNLFHTRSLSIDLVNPLTSFPLASPCDSVGGMRQGWYGWPCDPVLEARREDWLSAPDDAARASALRAIEAQAMRSLPFIPFGQMLLPVVRRRTVTGLIDMPVTVYWNVAV